jgi:hypothetical protein
MIAPQNKGALSLFSWLIGPLFFVKSRVFTPKLQVLKTKLWVDPKKRALYTIGVWKYSETLGYRSL